LLYREGIVKAFSSNAVNDKMGRVAKNTRYRETRVNRFQFASKRFAGHQEHGLIGNGKSTIRCSFSEMFFNLVEFSFVALRANPVRGHGAREITDIFFYRDPLAGFFADFFAIAADRINFT
jgi:hypothetical protein